MFHKIVLSMVIRVQINLDIHQLMRMILNKERPVLAWDLASLDHVTNENPVLAWGLGLGMTFLLNLRP